MKARLGLGEEVTKDAGSIAALLDELNLHGSHLGDGYLHLDLRLGAAVRAGHLHRGQHVKGTDPMDAGPARRRSDQVVGHEAELEEAEVAVGPGLLKKTM